MCCQLNLHQFQQKKFYHIDHRVEPEVTIVAEQPGIPITKKIPPGLTIQRMRGPPPLTSSRRLGMINSFQNPNLHRLPPPQQQRMNQQFSNSPFRMGQTSAFSLSPLRGNFPHRMKRTLPQSFSPISRQPPKRFRLPAQPPMPMLPVIPSASLPQVHPKRTTMCRLCLQKSSICWPLKDKPEIIEALKYALAFEIDLESDRMNKYPSSACRKCSSTILTFADFKRHFEVAQQQLKQTSFVEMTNEVENPAQIVAENNFSSDSIFPGSNEINTFCLSKFLFKQFQKLPCPNNQFSKMIYFELENFFEIFVDIYQ